MGSVDYKHQEIIAIPPKKILRSKELHIILGCIFVGEDNKRGYTD